MSKFRKLMAAATLLFAASSVFVACSDDDNSNMGPVGINSLQTTSTSATLVWTIVPNDKCDGYQVSICEGTRANMGAVVVDQTFDNRTARATFTGLQPNTSYVAITKAIPSKSSGFSGADTYEMEFMTAPIVHNVTAGAVSAYTKHTSKDAEGNDVVTYTASVTASWTALTGNATSYTVSIFRWALADESKPEGEKNKYQWKAEESKVIDNIATASYTFKDKVVPDSKYRIGVRPNPKNGDWYPTGETSYSAEFTSPAAPAE